MGNDTKSSRAVVVDTSLQLPNTGRISEPRKRNKKESVVKIKNPLPEQIIELSKQSGPALVEARIAFDVSPQTMANMAGCGIDTYLKMEAAQYTDVERIQRALKMLSGNLAKRVESINRTESCESRPPRVYVKPIKDTAECIEKIDVLSEQLYQALHHYNGVQMGFIK